MGINVKEIITQITLEIDREEISINEFKKAVDEFLGLIKEVTKESLPKKDSSAWLVKVYPGSAGIGVLKKPGVFTDEEVFVVRDNINKGLVLLGKGERHPFFNDKAIEHSRKLANLFTDTKMPTKVRLWGEQKVQPIDITKIISAKATYLLEAAYEDDGTVDGHLEKLSGHGHLEFVVYDLIDNHPITCEVSQDKLQDAWKSFLKRVEVIGTVRYRRDGMPVSVKAKEIIPFPSKEEIPDLNTIRKLLSNN
jgi:hypothetical protein